MSTYTLQTPIDLDNGEKLATLVFKEGTGKHARLAVAKACRKAGDAPPDEFLITVCLGLACAGQLTLDPDRLSMSDYMGVGGAFAGFLASRSPATLDNGLPALSPTDAVASESLTEPA
jgi:hypothetical protein